MVYTKEFIREKLLTNQTWLERGITAIYSKQTLDEQSIQATKEKNNIVFNGVDATLLSSFAIQINRGRHLSPKQLVYAKKKMIKYSGQLAEIANSKTPVKQDVMTLQFSVA